MKKNYQEEYRTWMRYDNGMNDWSPGDAQTTLADWQMDTIINQLAWLRQRVDDYKQNSDEQTVQRKAAQESVKVEVRKQQRLIRDAERWREQYLVERQKTAELRTEFNALTMEAAMLRKESGVG